MTSKSESAEEPTGAVLKTYIVRELDQAKILADPLKLKIIQAFASKPRTTKQVADLLDEAPTKLYRHVDALMEAGLIELVEERPKRGTVEKYLQAIAAKFVIDPTLFAPDKQLNAGDETPGIIDSIMDLTKEELKQLNRDCENQEKDHVLMRAQIRAPKEKIEELKEQLLSWIDGCQQMNAAEESDDDELDYAATIAFYPLDADQE